ncbi:uncharacterized protein LOC133187625 [Saccostrea echinata]|uniref:uncharacterized protein LOC133187625 n=1 Tax=Saccostrea echinata TaxID=191078 RepID=UPI002A839ADB|nr:uncharacterized protein LOC133187625 [Saccostrea echinata]
MALRIRLTLLVLVVHASKPSATHTWWDRSMDGPTCKEPGTCSEKDKTCECYLTIEHRLTLMTLPNPVLVWPKNGNLYRFDDESGSSPLPANRTQNVITADGFGSRLVITVNGLFPGPSIVAHENQDIIVHVRNLMHTDSTTIHWHGIHQLNTAYSDGVAFITQCPILPGQNYTYRFKAKPHGTHFYHAHIGDQRSMGLYGALIIYPENKFLSQPQVGFTVLLQDWNHNDDPETLYQRMLNGVYDPGTRKLIPTTFSVDGANFSRFHFHSGLINGMGRFYDTSSTSNGSPLQVFEVDQMKTYRFRVISAATLYPFRVYIEGHPELTIRASDGFEIVEGVGKQSKDLVVESFIIHPGERFDFTVRTSKEPDTYLFVAESLEVLDPSLNEYHAAEAIIHYKGSPFKYPSKATPITCSSQKPCYTFNCPYLYYPAESFRYCMNFDDVYSNEPSSDSTEIQNVSETLFFNFAFPGDHGYTPGSVNGHEFEFPSEPVLYRFSNIQSSCENANCGIDSICKCTYYEKLDKGKAYQFVLTNIGNGKGWSHPVHLHGHYFYVVKMGFGSYDRTSAKFISETNDIQCQGKSNNSFCNAEIWRNKSWNNADSIPGLKMQYQPQKDTIIVPTGGYVIVRFKASNPGPWFFHCHIDLHNTNGMGMILSVPSNSTGAPNFPEPSHGYTSCWLNEIKNEQSNGGEYYQSYIIKFK